MTGTRSSAAVRRPVELDTARWVGVQDHPKWRFGRPNDDEGVISKFKVVIKGQRIARLTTLGSKAVRVFRRQVSLFGGLHPGARLGP